jgi:hypothetical protein
MCLHPVALHYRFFYLYTMALFMAFACFLLLAYFRVSRIGNNILIKLMVVSCIVIRNAHEFGRMDLQEVGGNCGDWMELAQGRDRWRTLVGTARNLRVPKMRGIS